MATLALAWPLQAQTFTPGTWYVTDNPNQGQEKVRAEIVIDTNGKLYLKNLTQAGRTLSSVKYYESLFQVQIEKFSTTYPGPSKLLPPAANDPSVTFIGESSSPAPGSTTQNLQFIYTYDIDWGGTGQKDRVQIIMDISAGGMEQTTPINQRNLHGQWLDMIRWRISIYYPVQGPEPGTYTPKSWSRWARFPVIKFDVPQENKDHWFLISEHQDTMVHTPCTWNFFETYPSTDGVLRESFSMHPSGGILYDGNWQTVQSLQFKGWYIADPPDQNPSPPQPGKLFLMATDDMWGHPKRFMLRLTREYPSPLSPEKGGTPAKTGTALIKEAGDLIKYKPNAQGSSSSSKRSAPSWYTGRETVEFFVEHYGIRSFNKDERYHVEYRSPLCMKYNDPYECCPSYSVYTGILQCKSDAYWYDACEKYKKFMDAVPSQVGAQNLEPTLYSVPLYDRPNRPRLHTDGSLYLAWYCIDNSSTGAPNRYPDYSDDVKSWLAFFKRYHLGFLNKKTYCQLSVWSIYGGGMGTHGLLHEKYNPGYPRTPNKDIDPNGPHPGFPDFTRKLTGTPYTGPPMNETWTTLGVRFHPYCTLDDVYTVAINEETLTEGPHPLQEKAYIKKPWSNDPDPRWHPNELMIEDNLPLFKEPGQYCLGIDYNQISCPYLKVEYSLRDLVGVPVWDTPHQVSRYFSQCTGLYTDHLAGMGTKMCNDTGETNGSYIHAHLLRPQNQCLPDLPGQPNTKKYPAPGGAYHVYGRKHLEENAHAIGQALINGQINAGKRVNSDDKFYLLAESVEEYSASSPNNRAIDMTGQWVGLAPWLYYFHKGTMGAAGNYRRWRNNLTPPIFDLVYHDRLPLTALTTRDTLSPIMETDSSDQFFFSGGQGNWGDVETWVDYMCMAHGLEIVQGAQASLLFRDFSKMPLQQRPGQWSEWYHHPMIEKDASGVHEARTGFNPARKARSKFVWDTYLSYVQKIRTIREQCPWLAESVALRPLDRYWTTAQNLNQTLANPYQTVLARLNTMATAFNDQWPVSWYKSIRDYNTDQLLGSWNYVDQVLCGTFQYDKDPQDGVAFIFTNWSHHTTAGATFQFDPSWYGFQGQNVRVWWLVWGPDPLYPNDPTLGVWNVVDRGTINIGTGRVGITFHTTTVQQNVSQEILFYDGAANRPLKEREITVLVLGPPPPGGKK